MSVIFTTVIVLFFSYTRQRLVLKPSLLQNGTHKKYKRRCNKLRCDNCEGVKPFERLFEGNYVELFTACSVDMNTSVKSVIVPELHKTGEEPDLPLSQGG